MELSGQDSFFRTLIEEAPMAIVAVDSEGRITYTNRMLLEMLEYQFEDLVGRAIEVLLPPRLHEAHVGHRQSYLADPQRRPMGIGRDLLAVTKGGREIPVEIGLHPVYTAEGFRVAAVVVDISERLHQREMNERHDRLEAVGFLAGGLAHDYNNVLAGILGNIELLSRSSLDDRDRARLEAVRKLVAKGSSIARQLITFSKGGLPVFSVQDLVAVVRESAEISVSGTSISVAYRFAEPHLYSRIDKNQMSQVVTNLVINAVQAMPSGGHIVISGERVNGPQGPHIVVRIQDDGPGIPLDIQPKLFDPFFTTKAQGNGLGLAIVHSILEQHRGAIDLESTPGHGATFVLQLPAAIAISDPHDPDLLINPEFACSDTGKVLVMDDNDDVRDAMVLALRSCGYEVVECRHGEEALGLLRQSNQEEKPFSVLILDVMIPGQMGGLEVARVVRAQDSAIPIILMSGYTEAKVDRLKDQGIDEYLHKPFHLADLVKAVERLRCLDTPRRPGPG